MNVQTVKFAKDRRLPIGAALACSILLAGCAPRDTTLPTDITTALASAFTRGDVEACAALYSNDASIIADATTSVHGKPAIMKFFKDQVARDILFATDSAVSVVRGDLAMDQGTYRVRNVNRGVDVEYGQYLNVWRLEDGQWRVFRSMYNTTMSPRTTVSVTSGDEDTPVVKSSRPADSATPST